MRACPWPRVNNFLCNRQATSTIQYVMELHARYHKPVWLTEFSCAQAPPERQLAFAKEILPAL
jgi:hypothetical protein